MCAFNDGFKHIVQIMEHLGVWPGKNMERLEPWLRPFWFRLQKSEKKAQDLHKNLETQEL